ncbi:MAG: hypothetical protein NTX49_07155 [Chlamydiae bacterium]|nr:hypothetical protein [Chlamydiota bacterium]
MTTQLICTTTSQAPTERRHPSTPVPRMGFHFPESPKGSLHDLADRAQKHFTKTITLLETSLEEAQESFATACKILPKPSELAFSEFSGSDRAIYTAVQKRAKEVTELIQTALKSFGDA